MVQKKSGTIAYNETLEAESRLLVNQILSHDRAAFAKLMGRYYPSVYAKAYRTVKDSDDAADIAQAVFVKVSLHIDQYDNSKPFGLWLHRIAYNTTIDFIRRQRRHRHDQLEAHRSELIATNQNPEDLLAQKELSSMVEKAMSSLGKQQKRALLLRTIEGWPVAELARILGVPITTARWYLLKAKQQVRREIRRILASRKSVTSNLGSIS